MEKLISQISDIGLCEMASDDGNLLPLERSKALREYLIEACGDVTLEEVSETVWLRALDAAAEFERYAELVLGFSVPDVPALISQYGLEASDDRVGMSLWLSDAEAAAWVQLRHHGPVPGAWAEHHEAVLDLFGRAAEVRNLGPHS